MPTVAFNSGIDLLNIEEPTASTIVPLTISPYISVASTTISEAITFVGADPVSSIVKLSNFNQGGVCILIEVISDAFARRPSTWRLFERPSKLTLLPAVTFIDISALLKANK